MVVFQSQKVLNVFAIGLYMHRLVNQDRAHPIGVYVPVITTMEFYRADLLDVFGTIC